MRCQFYSARLRGQRAQKNMSFEVAVKWIQSYRQLHIEFSLQLLGTALMSCISGDLYQNDPFQCVHEMGANKEKHKDRLPKGRGMHATTWFSLAWTLLSILVLQLTVSKSQLNELPSCKKAAVLISFHGLITWSILSLFLGPHPSTYKESMAHNSLLSTLHAVPWQAFLLLFWIQVSFGFKFLKIAKGRLMKKYACCLGALYLSYLFKNSFQLWE